jgi:hypothetical protein
MISPKISGEFGNFLLGSFPVYPISACEYQRILKLTKKILIPRKIGQLRRKWKERCYHWPLYLHYFCNISLNAQARHLDQCVERWTGGGRGKFAFYNEHMVCHFGSTHWHYVDSIGFSIEQFVWNLQYFHLSGNVQEMFKQVGEGSHLYKPFCASIQLLCVAYINRQTPT